MVNSAKQIGVNVPIGKLKPNPTNPRVLRDEKFLKLKKSIHDFPDMLNYRSIVAVTDTDGKYMVLGGNMRLRALQDLGIKEVPVMLADHWTEEQRREFIIKDNVGFGEWDWDQLANEWDAEKLSEWGMDLPQDFGAETNEGLTDPDAAPAVQENPVTVPGDVWIMGKHRLMCGDSTSISAVEMLMAGEKADMVFTDPPYGVSYEDSKGRKIQNDELVDDKLQEFVTEAFSCGVAICKDGAAWFVWHASRFQREFENALNQAGLKVRQQIIWVKGQGVDGTAQVQAPAIGRSHFRWLHEPCFYASKTQPFNAGDRKTTTVWTVTRQTTGTVHPTQKPVALIEIALENSSKSDDVVLDLFGGSGSTLIACEKTNRQARLMELDPRYCDVIVKRWQDFTGQQAIHEASGKTFAELSEDQVTTA